MTSSQSAPKIAGIFLIAGSVLMIFAMLHHPTGHEHEFSDFIKEVRSIQAVNAAVHGGAIGLLAVFLFSFSYLSDRLCWKSAEVRLATIFYGLGSGAMVVAAMVSGFIVPFFLARYATASASEMEIGQQALGLLREFNRAFDQLGVIGISIGVLFWSIALVNRKSLDWLSGVLGISAGALGIAGVFSGHLEASVPGIIAFVVLQGIWNIRIGYTLLRDRKYILTTAQADS